MRCQLRALLSKMASYDRKIKGLTRELKRLEKVSAIGISSQ